MKRRIGMILVSGSGLLKVLLYISVAVGIWGPVGKTIVGNPVSIFWWGPIGLILTMVSFWISGFLYDLLMSPITLVAGWLLKDSPT